jgi:hypothetical protein
MVGMMWSWGDGLWENIAILKETAGMSLEPAPLHVSSADLDARDHHTPLNLKGLKVSPRCTHCNDPYLEADSDPEYMGLCEGCAEYFRDLDRQDELVNHA